MDIRRSTNFTFAHEGILYVMLFAALACERLLLGLSWGTVAASLAMACFIGAVGSALHSSFHVKGFELERFQWYKELRALHYIHHLGSTQHNFGVFNIGMVDGVLNSVRLTDPVKKTQELQVCLLQPLCVDGGRPFLAHVFSVARSHCPITFPPPTSWRRKALRATRAVCCCSVPSTMKIPHSSRSVAALWRGVFLR
jgi:hypothetical protein